MQAAVTISCRARQGELLGELSILDRRGRRTLDGEGEVSISELGDYLVRLVGPLVGRLRFAPPIEPLPTMNGGEIFGLLGRPPGLGVVRLEIRTDDGELRWRRDVPVRPEKLQDRAEFEGMIADLCRWRTALALDLYARSSAPWVWSETTHALTPEERLVVLRAAVEDNRLYENINRVERSALVRLNRDVELIALGGDEVDAFRLGRYMNSPGARTRLPSAHPLASRIASLPSQLPPARKVETIDTPENQFVKVAIRRFRQGLAEALRELRCYADSPLVDWGHDAERQLARAAASSFFAGISWPAQVELGSPALQGRAGYRSILQAFLDLRAGFSMPWDELGSAVFGETRDVATVYEFWCLVKLREALEAELGVNLDLDPFLMSSGRLTVRRGAASRSGAPIMLNGEFFAMTLYYNRTFQPSTRGSVGGFQMHGATVGTWSKPMKPDFTVSLYPPSLSEEQAAEQKLLRLVHFDAKYRLKKLLAEGESTHMPDDVDKMHAYAAAINHSRGAYALFPGDAAELFAAPASLDAVGAIPIAPDRADAFRPTLRLILERAATV